MMRYQKTGRVILAPLVFLILMQAGRADQVSEPLAHGVPTQAPGLVAPADPSAYSSLQMVGQVGGCTEDVAVQGAYAYVAVGLRLVVLDVSQPITPTEIGRTTPFPQFVEGVTVSETLAYIADGMAGLRIVDVSDPATPVEVGAYDTPGYAEGVAVSGRYAYVADGHYGLRVVDVSDPAHPAEVSYAYPLNYVFDAVVDGQYAYLAAAGARLLVVDISDPAHPTEMGTYDTPGYAYGVDVDGDVAYIADGWEHMRVVDVSDPANPADLASYSTPGWAFGVTVSDTVAYVADAFAGLQVVDVSDPTHPGGLGGEEVSRGHAGRVVVVGSTAYVADRNRGLRVVDVSDPGAPGEISFYGPVGYATEVAVSGNYAYIAAGTYGLRVVDISDPVHPVQMGAYDTHSLAINVATALDGNYAYVATFGFGPGVEAGLHVVDVSDPAHPTGVGYYGPAWAFRDMAVAGGIAYIADEWGLDIVDVSSPYTPTLLADVNLQGEEWRATSGIDVVGNLAYVVGSGGLHIVDVSDPVSSTLVSHLAGQYLYYASAEEDKVYVTGDSGCLTAIDASDPLHPVELGAHCEPYYPERVTVVDATAYVAFGSGGLLGIDFADPLSPTLAFSYDTPGYVVSSAVVSNTIYVADADGGLLILEADARQFEAREPTWSMSPAAVPAADNRVPDQPLASDFAGRASLNHRTRHMADLQPTPSPHHRSDVQPATSSRSIAGTCVVTSTADNGPGTLRSCMDNAISGDTITFDPGVFPPQSPVTISLQTGLPSIWQGNLTIDASDTGVVLDGSALPDGSILSISSDGNVIKGLQILNSPYGGVGICCGAKHNVIGGDRTRGNGPTGEGNVISGNASVGIMISDAGTDHNTVMGNLIGTDASGTEALSNLDGVVIQHDASHNTIGSLIPGEGNVISGNDNNGVVVDSNDTMNNGIIGNFIGTDVSGTADLGNRACGVWMEIGVFHNTVRGNLISGNDWMGVGISNSSYNTVVGNLMGTDFSGTRALGNDGILIAGDFNRVGGTLPGDGNVASGVGLGAAHDSVVLGNLIRMDEVRIWGESRHNFIGGTTEAERNIISGQPVVAEIRVDGTDLHFILGNYIGTDASGAVSLGNPSAGIDLNGAKHNVIQNNLISGNEHSGVSLNVNSQFNHLRANRIGVAADGASPLPNGSDGVSISAVSNIIGGTYPEDGNVIAYNGNVGIQVWTHPGNTIRRNSIYGNAGPGVFLADGGNNSLLAPIITEVLPTSVSGSACPGCIVEIFSDEEDEGQVYEGYTIADGNGKWTWMGSPNGPYVTATATDQAGNTSAFAGPRTALWHQVHLPLVLREDD